MEALTVAHIKQILAFLPDNAPVIANGGQGNLSPAWSIEPKEDEKGNIFLEIMY